MLVGSLDCFHTGDLWSCDPLALPFSLLIIKIHFLYFIHFYCHLVLLIYLITTHWFLMSWNNSIQIVTINSFYYFLLLMKCFFFTDVIYRRIYTYFLLSIRKFCFLRIINNFNWLLFLCRVFRKFSEQQKHFKSLRI